jgi:predicted XRE-type DNA-binding protein
MQNGDKPRRKKKVTKRQVQASSGNVFRDLGVPDPDEALAKAELVRQISDIITKQKLTQAKAASILGVDQPKVSALIRGHFEGFSTDRLFRFLNALGRDVEIVIRPIRHRDDQPGTRVLSL